MTGMHRDADSGATGSPPLTVGEFVEKHKGIAGPREIADMTRDLTALLAQREEEEVRDEYASLLEVATAVVKKYEAIRAGKGPP